jgi:6-phosphogluconolactonase
VEKGENLEKPGEAREAGADADVGEGAYRQEDILSFFGTIDYDTSYDYKRERRARIEKIDAMSSDWFSCASASFPANSITVSDQMEVSRRSFLLRIPVLIAASAALRLPSLQAQERQGEVLAYVGCYTDHGEGIYIFRVDEASGELAPWKVVKGVANPSWLTVHPTRPLLYASNEETKGGVTAFVIQPDGDLRAINRYDSMGSDPAHLSVHSSGKYLLVSNFSSGNVAAFPIQADGGLGAATDTRNDTAACDPACAVGPTHPVKGPEGNFPEDNHHGAHAHMIASDRSGKFVFVDDLGLDRTIVWRFDVEKGTLADPHWVAASAGSGTRHFVLHPNQRWFYSLTEHASTLSFMMFNPTAGLLNPVQETTLLPAAYKGTSAGSEIALSPDGRYLYAGNRLHNSIAIFVIGKDGTTTLMGEEWTRGDHVRHFNFDPSGKFFYACNQRSDNITVFRADRATGKLSFTGKYTPVGSVSCIVFRKE